MRAMLMPGVTIEGGVIVAAGSVVTANVAAYTIVAGNPAKLIAQRFDPSVITRLLALNTYQLSPVEFAVIRPYLTANDTDELEQAVAMLSVS